MRILVTVKPRMYREAIALSIHQHHPDFVVTLAPLRTSFGSWRTSNRTCS